MERSLTAQQAYLAMFAFLDQYWRRGRSEDIATLLGSLSLLPGGGSPDLAQTDDWNAAVELALSGKVDAQIHLSR